MAQTRLKQLREEAVLTVHELAEASGVSDDTISKIETGQRVARPSTLRKLAGALDVSPQELRRPAKVEEPVPLDDAPREAGRLKVPELPETEIANWEPEQVDARLRELDATNPIGELVRAMDRERGAIAEWLRAYHEARSEERLARRADAEHAKEKRALLQLYRTTALDYQSKLLDPRGVPFKTVVEIAVETFGAQGLLHAVVRSETERQRLEKSGEPA
jgi:transcriptional regulator with XRE-family HTH domain